MFFETYSFFQFLGMSSFIFKKKLDLNVLNCARFHSDRFSQDVLSKLKNKETIKNVLFYPVPCWDERDHPFDFRLFSKQIQVHLPNVELVYIKHMLVLNFRLESSRCVHFCPFLPQATNLKILLLCDFGALGIPGFE